MKSEHTNPLEGTGEYHVTVDVPIDSPEYQAFLEANRRREMAREENGAPDPEAEDAYLEAVKNVSDLAKNLLTNNRSQP